MSVWLRRLLWILGVPLFVAAVLLNLQGFGSDIEAIAPVERLEAPRRPAERFFEFRLEGVAGAALEHAVVIVTAPELAQAEVRADGLVRVALRAPGPLRLLAWAPGYQVTEAGPWDSAPRVPLQLLPLEEPEIPLAAPIPLADRRLRILQAGGQPLPFALVLARPADQAAAAAWIAVADAEGMATLRAGAEALDLEVYTPGRLAVARWRLATRRLAPAGVEDPVQELFAVCGDLEVHGLHPGEAIELRREGATEDLAVADAAGIARWRWLPPGPWEVALEAGGAMAVEVTAEGVSMTWQ